MKGAARLAAAAPGRGRFAAQTAPASTLSLERSPGKSPLRVGRRRGRAPRATFVTRYGAGAPLDLVRHHTPRWSAVAATRPHADEHGQGVGRPSTPSYYARARVRTREGGGATRGGGLTADSDPRLATGGSATRTPPIEMSVCGVKHSHPQWEERLLSLRLQRLLHCLVRAWPLGSREARGHVRNAIL
jgi:hypothetical protein